MKKIIHHIFSLLIVSVFALQTSRGQTHNVRSCSYEDLVDSERYARGIELNELEINKRLQDHRLQTGRTTRANYTIPVVLHVFHDGEDGLISYAQALSGLEVINRDFAGLNDDYADVDPDFNNLKATLNVSFQLAKIDAKGNPTDGVIYHDDSLAMLNQKDLLDYAWDNKKYLNIYLPKYVFGEPSLRTGFGYYPSLFNVNRNRDGIIYSSVRWGYGDKSELLPGDEWASTATHEVGHWLNLFHTFEFGCQDNGDRVEDTPPAVVDSLYLEGCDNTNFSCGVKTNGENYMDYNLRCRKMFTKGQTERMEAALHLSSRNNLWSVQNLLEVGLKEVITAAPPNAEPKIILRGDRLEIVSQTKMEIEEITLYDTTGRLLTLNKIAENEYKIDSKISSGFYIYILRSEQTFWTGKLIF